MFNDDGCAEDVNVKKQQQQSLIKVSSTRRNKYIDYIEFILLWLKVLRFQQKKVRSPRNLTSMTAL